MSIIRKFSVLFFVIFISQRANCDRAHDLNDKYVLIRSVGQWKHDLKLHPCYKGDPRGELCTGPHNNVKWRIVRHADGNVRISYRNENRILCSHQDHPRWLVLGNDDSHRCQWKLEEAGNDIIVIRNRQTGHRVDVNNRENCWGSWCDNKTYPHAYPDYEGDMQQWKFYVYNNL
jgi:hypothetical protein